MVSWASGILSNGMGQMTTSQSPIVDVLMTFSVMLMPVLLVVAVQFLAIAKGAIAITEYAVSTFIPGGVFLVLGFEVLDANFHFTDNIYKSFDPSY